MNDRSGKGSRARAGAAKARLRVGEAILLISRLVALVIIVGILLVVLEANPDNQIVGALTDAAAFLVGPFEALFTLDDQKAQVAVNYGVAAVVYLVVGRLIAGLIRP